MSIAAADSFVQRAFSRSDLFDGLQGVRLRRPRVREVSVGFGLDCLVTTFMKNPG